MRSLKHIGDRELAAFIELKLQPGDAARVLHHLDECDICEQRLEILEPSLSAYRRQTDALYAEAVNSLWPELAPKLNRVEASRRTVVPIGANVLRWGWTGAIAAILLASVLLIWPRGGPQLRVETLLSGVEARVEAVAPKGRLRIRTRRTSFVRPMVVDGGGRGNADEEVVRSHFAAAHFDWSNPLSPEAFEEWRRSLRRKTDRVLAGAGPASGERRNYTIRTSSEGSALKEASLVIEASAMLPVGAEFVFADQEWVEVTAMSDAEPLVSPTPAF